MKTDYESSDKYCCYREYGCINSRSEIAGKA